MQLTEQQQDKLSKVQLEESWKRSLTPFLLS
ncbi:uracil-DNA glycosylase, partial [Acinetobacter baumannii]|nr:uracil-DNA glycosylase [Acinetobacter baumannii]